jgi:hypothetical protein
MTKENTLFRTHEIKSTMIKSHPKNPFITLCFYIKDANYQKFCEIFEKNKIGINSVDEDNNSLLNLAVQCNCYEIAQYVLNCGCDPNLQNVF